VLFHNVRKKLLPIAGTLSCALTVSDANPQASVTMYQSVNIAMELSASAGLTVNLTGGSMRWAGAFSLIGSAAVEPLKMFVMDRVFIGVCGVDQERGATTIEPDEAAVFRAMVAQSKQVVVIADSSKVGMVSPAVICATREIHVLITDDGVSEEMLAGFSRAGVQILIV